jgi:predicted PurR-regulated permease PerM
MGGGLSETAYLRRLLVTVAVVAGALLVWELQYVLLLIFGAVLMAVLLRAFADLLHRWLRLGQGWSLLLAGGLIVLLVVGAVTLAGAQIQAQLAQLIQELPAAWKRLENHLPELRAQVEQLPAPSTSLVAGFAGVLGSMASALADLVIIAFGGIFFAVQPQLYRDGCLLLFPRNRRPQIAQTLDACGVALRHWLVAQLTCMAMVGTALTLGLWLIGVPSALALGLIAALAEFVPMVGPVLAAIPALLMALSQDLTTLLLTLALFVVVQQIESNLLLPALFRRTISLPPVVTIFAVVGFGYLLGIYGLLFAAPLAVVTYVAVAKLYVRDTLGEDITVPGEE